MSGKTIDLGRYHAKLGVMKPQQMIGRVTQVTGPLIYSQGPAASVGEVCYVYPGNERAGVLCEVVGFRDRTLLLMAFNLVEGIGPGSDVVSRGMPLTVRVGNSLLGRVLDGLGDPIDGRGPLGAVERRSIYSAAPDPLRRQSISLPIGTGIRAIDAFVTCGRGQRMGIFAGSGVGKSVLLGQIARSSEAAVNVIALIGERGREVRQFLENNLGEAGLKRSVVVTVTSDEPALRRIKGALVATTIAEYFRDKGMDVMLMMDSITRLAVAQREVGLSSGEPPTTRGYPPSVFAMMPKLLERAGTAARGSITGLYTVLVEGDDMDEPVSDHVRSILDGHIVLSRKLATRHHFPAIDILHSISRVMPDVVTQEHREAVQRLRALYAVYEDARDMINIGAYVPGSNTEIDRAIEMVGPINDMLRQETDEVTNYSECEARLIELASACEGLDQPKQTERT